MWNNFVFEFIQLCSITLGMNRNSNLAFRLFSTEIGNLFLTTSPWRSWPSLARNPPWRSNQSNEEMGIQSQFEGSNIDNLWKLFWFAFLQLLQFVHVSQLLHMKCQCEVAFQVAFQPLLNHTVERNQKCKPTNSKDEQTESDSNYFNTGWAAGYLVDGQRHGTERHMALNDIQNEALEHWNRPKQRENYLNKYRVIWSWTSRITS